VLAICASFRAWSLTGSSAGLIITAHASPYLFFPPSSCTYNSHIKKRKFSCVLYAHSQLLCSLQILNCQPWVSAIPAHTFWSTAIRRDIRAALCFCSCELPWRSTECVLLPRFNALPDIFADMNCSVSGDHWYNIRLLQWHTVAYNE